MRLGCGLVSAAAASPPPPHSSANASTATAAALAAAAGALAAETRGAGPVAPPPPLRRRAPIVGRMAVHCSDGARTPRAAPQQAPPRPPSLAKARGMCGVATASRALSAPHISRALFPLRAPRGKKTCARTARREKKQVCFAAFAGPPIGIGFAPGIGVRIGLRGAEFAEIRRPFRRPTDRPERELREASHVDPLERRS